MTQSLAAAACLQASSRGRHRQAAQWHWAGVTRARAAQLSLPLVPPAALVVVAAAVAAGVPLDPRRCRMRSLPAPA